MRRIHAGRVSLCDAAMTLQSSEIEHCPAYVTRPEPKRLEFGRHDRKPDQLKVLIGPFA